jgi:hypothetical protein
MVVADADGGSPPARPPRRRTPRRWWPTVVVTLVVAVGGALAWPALAPTTDPAATVVGLAPSDTPGAPPRAVVQRWSLPQEQPVLALVLVDTHVVVADQAGSGRDPLVRLRALDLATGRATWTRELPAHAVAAVVADGDVVLTVAQWWTTPPGVVLGVSLADGTTTWAHDELDGVLGLRGSPEGLLAADRARCVLLDAATGRVRRTVARDPTSEACPGNVAPGPLRRDGDDTSATVRVDDRTLELVATPDTLTVHGPEEHHIRRRTRDPLRQPQQLTSRGLLLPGPGDDWTSLGLYDYRDLAARWTVDLGDSRVLRLASSDAGVVVLSRGHPVARERAGDELRGFS